MCTRTALLPVVTPDELNTDNNGFILLPLEGLTARYPFLAQPHRLSCYAVIFCMQTGGAVEVERQAFTLAEASVICIGLNSVLHFEPGPTTSGWIMFFSAGFFSLKYNEHILSQFSWLQMPGGYRRCLAQTEMEEWTFSLNRIRREVCEKGDNMLPVLRSHLNILLSEFHRRVPVRHPLAGASEKFSKILQFESLIEKEYSVYHLPSYYARALHISVNYLNRISKEFRGRPAGELIRSRVGLEAERLLLHTSKTVSEISELLGFRRPAYFTTFFKRFKGASPELFRKRHIPGYGNRVLP